MLDFSASINPLGPPRSARGAFLRSWSELARYPDPYGEKLKAALGERHGMNSAEILLGNGSTQLIYLLCAALRPRAALIVAPAFSEYANALALSGASARTHAPAAADGFHFSLDSFFAAWDKDCDLVFLAHPNSVTGRLLEPRALEAIAAAALARKTPVVIDEAFIDFIEDASAKRLVRDHPYFLVLRSLTKFYGIPGLRLGYLLGDARRIAQLAHHQQPWAVGGPALSVALACLSDAGFAAKTGRWLEGERNFLWQRIGSLKEFSPLASQANFLLVRIERAGADARALQKFLARRKILVRTCRSFGLGANYFRIAVRRRSENRRLIAALGDWSRS